MVELFKRYRARVHFVIIDMDVPRRPVQQALVRRFYRGDTPDLVVVSGTGRVVLNVVNHKGKPVTPLARLEAALGAAEE